MNTPYTNSGHGHAWARPDGVKARCGGVALCSDCAKDLVALQNWTGKHPQAELAPAPPEEPKPSCRTCIYWLETRSWVGPGFVMGLCRRNAPVMTSDGQSRHPETTDTDVCGEWRGKAA